MANKKPRKEALIWIIAVLCCVAIVAIIVTVVLQPKPGKDINSFQACKDAGGAILESYPEQCMLDGRSFTNTAQSIGDMSGYSGLAEQAALDKAKAENRSARVVERNGESLPVTMDFAPGRLNLYVNDGKVYRVQVEGE